MLDNPLMHESEWIVFIDGEEIARVSRREAADIAISKRLSKS